MANRLRLTYHCPMSRVAKVKNGFVPKTCQRCGLEFEWRKKWAKSWTEVKYCSDERALEVLEGLQQGKI